MPFSEDELKQQAQFAELEEATAANKQSEAKAAARQAFIGAGGRPADFEKVWPDIWREHLIKRAATQHDERLAMTAKAAQA